MGPLRDSIFFVVLQYFSLHVFNISLGWLVVSYSRVFTRKFFRAEMHTTRRTETGKHAKLIASRGLTRLRLPFAGPIVFLRGILVLISLLASTALNVDQGASSVIVAGSDGAAVGGGYINTVSQ